MLRIAKERALQFRLAQLAPRRAEPVCQARDVGLIWLVRRPHTDLGVARDPGASAPFPELQRPFLQRGALQRVRQRHLPAQAPVCRSPSRSTPLAGSAPLLWSLERESSTGRLARPPSSCSVAPVVGQRTAASNRCSQSPSPLRSRRRLLLLVPVAGQQVEPTPPRSRRRAVSRLSFVSASVSRLRPLDRLPQLG